MTNVTQIFFANSEQDISLAKFSFLRLMNVNPDRAFPVSRAQTCSLRLYVDRVPEDILGMG